MTVATDNFNRGDGPLGANWAVARGTIWDVDTNRATPPVASQWHGSYWDADSFGNDQYSKATWITADNNSGTWTGPGVRMSSGNYYNAVQNGTDIELWRYVDPTQTQLTGTAHTGTDGDEYKCEIIGTALKGYVEDVEEVSTTDSNIASGKPGLYTYYAVQPFWDDWEGGDIVSGRIMGSLARYGGLAGAGGIAGQSGGLAA